MKRLVFLLVVLLPFFMRAQFSVSGYVSSNSSPILGAVVKLDNSKITSTDDQGFFVFKDLKPKTYIIEVSYLGFEKYTKKISLSTDTVLKIKLVESVENQLDQIVVNSTRATKTTPFTYTTLTSKEIKNNNQGQDMPYLLALTPSVVTTSDAGNGIGYTNFSIRGTDMTRINVTINGVPLNDPESHGVWWVDLPDLASSVQNIQIQRGVGTSTNGAGAFGASVNIKTETLNKSAFCQISNSYGSFNSYKNTVELNSGLINKHYIFNTRLSRIHSDGYIDRARSDLKSFYFSGAYLNDKTIVKAIIFSGLEETYQAWYGVPKDSLKTHRTYNPYTYDNEIDHYLQTHYQLHFIHKFNENLALNVTPFLVEGGGYYEQYKEEQDYTDYGLEPVIIDKDTISSTDLIRRKWLKNSMFGLNYNLVINKPDYNLTIGGSSNRYIGSHFGRIIWMQYAGTTPIRYQWYNNAGVKNDMDVYTKFSYKINSKIWTYTDLQIRKITYVANGIDDDLSTIGINKKYTFFNPKVGITYLINNKMKVYGSFAVAHREPKRDDFIDAPTTKQPVPEVLYDYEAGYKLNLQKLYLSANVYYMDYKNQLILTGEINDVGNPIVTNTPHSFRRGIELAFATQLAGFLEWKGNLTLSQNKILNFTEYVDNWDYWEDNTQPLQITNYLGTTDIAFSPSVIASNMLTFNLFDKTKLTVMSKYVGRQYIDNTSSLERSLDPYFVTDILLTTEFYNLLKTRQLFLSVKINNIFNRMYETNAWVYSYYYHGERYEMNGYFPQAGTNFLATLTIKF